MESKRARKILISFLLTTSIISQSLEVEFADQNTLSPPNHDSHKTSPSPPAPSYNESECNCGPNHHKKSPPPPCGGGGGYYNSPSPSPTVGPISPAPIIPVEPPTPITFRPTPTTPSISTPPSPPFLPVDPNAPPFTTGGSPPYIPVDPNAPPFTPGGSPFTPGGSPPYIPVDPNTPPFTPGGSPPYIPVDPITPPSTPGGTPGTSTYWSTNPTLIWGIFGYWATIGGLFGTTTTLPFGTSLRVQDALANTRTDGFGALYREGTASLLNSLVNNKFPFTTKQVRHAFASSLVSEKAAADQARVFKLANEGRLKKKH